MQPQPAGNPQMHQGKRTVLARRFVHYITEFKAKYNPKVTYDRDRQVTSFS